MPSDTAAKMDKCTLYQRCLGIRHRNWSQQEINDWVNILHPDNRQEAARLLRPETDIYETEVNALNRWTYEGFKRIGRIGQSEMELKRAIWEVYDNKENY